MTYKTPRWRPLILLMGWAATLCTTQAATFTEVGDAGLLTSTANNASNSIAGTPLDAILGTLSANDADVFRILLTAGTAFSATTVSSTTSFFDTVLTLYDSNGKGILANDDDPLSPPQSTLGFTPVTTGEYYLAISGFGFFPQSSGGFIFPVTAGFLATGVVGPTGPGGASALSAWVSGSGETGPYTISLTGAQFTTATPEPASFALVAAALVAAWMRFKKEKVYEQKL